ncbi:addiction module protein [Pontiellaceae bacterium B12227]|nr:addiction module protein [Pontiellaceae bacterium B12227]
MTALMDQVFKEALELPLDQRLTVVYRILEQSDAGMDAAEVEREWDQVVRERIARYDAGQTRSCPAAEVFAELDKRLGHDG